MTKQIPLTKGQFALVDDEDYEVLSKFRWYVLNNTSGIQYAARICKRDPAGKRPHVFMHRQIMGLIPGDNLLIDHINRDGLDNTRTNLRVCTDSQNNMNRVGHGVSGVKGVRFREGHTNPWEARIGVNRESIYLGMYATKELARAAYQEAARVYYGEFAIPHGSPEAHRT